MEPRITTAQIVGMICLGFAIGLAGAAAVEVIRYRAHVIDGSIVTTPRIGQPT